MVSRDSNYHPTGTVPKEVNLNDLIRRELAKELRNEKPRDNSYLHASSVGDCRRKQGYVLLGESALPNSDNLLHVFDLGTAIHIRLQERLVGMGWVKPENIELKLHNDELKLGGTCDALSEPLFGGNKYVIDIKTITARPRVQYDSEGNLFNVDKSSYEHLEKPKTNHLMQVNLYSWLWCVDKINFPDLMLIYVAKDVGWDNGDDLPYKVFTSKFDPELLETTLKRAEYIHKKIQNEQLPAKDYYFSEKNRAWQCSSCNYRPICLPQFFGKDGECLIG